MEGDVVRQAGLSAALAIAACRAPEAPRATVTAWDSGSIHVTGAPPLDPAITAWLAPYADVVGSRLVDVSADGTRVLVTTRGELFELDGPGAEPRRIETDGDVRWAAYLGTSIAVATDRDGDERLVLRRGDVIVAEAVADPIVAEGRLLWAVHLDGGRRTELFVDGVRVFGGAGMWAPTDVRVDGEELLARHRVAARTSAVYRIDVATGVATALTPIDRRAAAIDARYVGQETWLVAADLGADVVRLVEIDEGGAHEISKEGEVEELGVSPDRGRLAFTTALAGVSRLHTHRIDDKTDAIAGIPRAGVISDPHLARDAVFFTYTDPRRPRGVYEHDLRKASPLVRWTRGDADALHPIAPQHAQVASFDGTPIALDVYAPSARAPVVVELHGGPEDAWRPRWQGFEQFLVARGFAVVQPNVRGSAGQGAAFAALDDGRRRQDAVRDVGAVLDWIATRPELDASRVVVIGTSYGGYLALATLARYPARVRGGIVLSGITDFVAFLDGTRADRRDDRRAEYGDERDPATRAFLASISPRADQIRAPLLVAHGRRDPRVPIAATDRFVAALRAAGRDVWYVAADDEGHGFAKSHNRGVFEVLAVQFLEALAR